MTLSLCMIVKDEAERLAACLTSVKDFVDEMIVFDTGSKDDTIAIAEQAGAKVQTIEWTEDFAAARNRSLELATGAWILVLDADETLTTAGQTLLQRLRAGDAISNQPLDSVLAVNLLRHEVDAEQAPYSEVTRLFRNRADLRFQHPYHETIDGDVEHILHAEPQWQVVSWPEVAIAHRGYEAAAIAQRNKFARAEAIMAAYLANHPDDAYIGNKLGALYISAGQGERGCSLLERALASGQADASTTYELHYHLGIAYRQMKLLAIAVDHYTKALSQPIAETLKIGARLNLGSLLLARKDYSGASAQFEQITHVAPNFAPAYFNLGIVKRNIDDLEGAVSAYQRAIAINPAYAVAYQNLGVALFKLNRVSDSIQAFRQAVALYRETNPTEADRLLKGIHNLGLQPNTFF